MRLFQYVTCELVSRIEGQELVIEVILERSENSQGEGAV